ncbi:FAD-dependent oxidoreductase [Paenibacillus lutimineralis]|uniref:FAD-dependent oxidoreductase n=1 Tax=Paenibacillus lutimineralis TaxID=2707005 RepID=A0A3Q9I8W4_9BACL|nr:FAD-dependent oxidoreductase [Paenibacillus lutimineralis]AZS13711.1 FAD-dependent oxidoreductase [Paenibacillus lutimineralis]
MGNERMTDVVVLGGGLGGCMAALAAAKMGVRVIMTEETDWLGGQLTSQAVPPDEHQWIEEFGCTETYREFRDRVRAYYQENYPMTEEAKNNELLNPGNGWVSRLCHEPKVALRVIEDMLAPYVNSGRITVMYHFQPTAASVNEDQIESVTVTNINSGEEVVLRGAYFIDATECGDVLPLAGVEYVTGAESRHETGEPHALEEANPLDMQSITHVFALDYVEGGNFTIEKPEQYDFWRQFVPKHTNIPLLSWFANDTDDAEKMKEFTLFPGGTDASGRELLSLWTYRRIIDPSLIETGLYESDITLINWPQNDYFLGSIIDVSEAERQEHLANARQLSLSLVYWLQTETPRPDGGKGYPGIRLRTDVLGTEDGLAKYPYIRESRRIKAMYAIKEQDVSKEVRGEQGICRYDDSVGVGSYHLDVHLTTVTNRTFYIPNYPYEIPLGALLPIRVKNLLPACKNIGTTQITNGCYRLHPTEWNIGESVGYLAAYALQNQVTPREVRANTEHLRAYQALIQRQGVQIHWPDDLVL